MFRHIPPSGLCLAVLVCFACPALAQSSQQGVPQPGSWYRGRWMGYVPPHLKQATRAVLPPQTTSNPGPKATATSDSHRGAVLPVSTDSPPKTATAGQAQPDGQQGVVQTSFQEPLAVGADGALVDPYGSVAAPAASWAAGCEGQAGCGYGDACASGCDVQASCGYGGPCASGWDGRVGCLGPRVWGRAEYLLWWTDEMQVPPLVTTSTDGTAQDEAGVLGQSGTSTLFGGSGLISSTRSGGRFTLGLWLDPCRRSAVQASYLMLGDKTETFSTSEADFAILARPFFNVSGDPAALPAHQDALLIAFEDFVEGSIAVSAKAGFQEAEVLFRHEVFQGCDSHLDFLMGYQFARLDDELRIDQSTVSLDEEETIVPLGTTIELFDLFDTSNEFHGAELGVVFRERVCRWSLDLLMKLGLGSTHSRATIDGSTVTTVPDEDPATTAGGLLALPSNIGIHERDDFAMIPELGVTLGYDVTCNLRATLGYNFIYWSKVARAGDQIDLDVNPTQFGGGTLTGEPRPEFSWVTTDFWAQGLKFGLDYRY